MKLANKVALITGGNSGIGFATARPEGRLVLIGRTGRGHGAPGEVGFPANDH
jgi:NAD(P)-dependent dehydrogenase (short-subunit alcohol dehydrogenase family)